MEVEEEPFVYHIGRNVNQMWAPWNGEVIEQGRNKNTGKMLVKPKPYIRFTEGRKDNIMKYEEAIESVPLIATALMLKADMTVAYGYRFAYEQFDEPLEDRLKERLKFLQIWKRKVELDEIIRKISLCMDVYGDAIVEKVPDDRTFYEGGWGIKELKVIHPATVELKRDAYGKITGYVQDITKADTSITGNHFVRKFEKFKGVGSNTNENIIECPPERVVHFKNGDLNMGAYGRSIMRPLRTTINMMLGIQDDFADIIRTMARPLTVWYMGDAENPMPKSHMQKIARMISQGLSMGSDIAIDGRVRAEVIGAGTKVMDIESYLDYIVRLVGAGLGVPVSLLGLVPSTSGQSEEIMLELFRRRIMARQAYIGQKIVNEIFRDIFVLDPSIDYFDVYRMRRKIKDITPIQYAEIPYIKWNVIEDVANRRLRVREEVIAGTMTLKEARAEFDRPEYYDKNDLHPQLRQFDAQAIALKKQVELQERQLDIQEKSLDSNVGSISVSGTRATNTRNEAVSTKKLNPSS